jgi:hypothetical protein
VKQACLTFRASSGFIRAVSRLSTIVMLVSAIAATTSTAHPNKLGRLGNGLRLTTEQSQAFQATMASVPLPGTGCFKALYPAHVWQRIRCIAAPVVPFPVAKGPKPLTVGGGTGYFVVTSGRISSATGSFDSVSGVTSEFSPNNSDSALVHPNTYALQLNSNTFQSGFCGSSSPCMAWQQFIYSQTPSKGGLLFIQYWLLDHSFPCPASGPARGWNYYPGDRHSRSGCYGNSPMTGGSVQALADLRALQLTGRATGGNDRVSFSSSGTEILASGQKAFLGLLGNWTGSEYNIFGDCCSSKAYFNAGTAIKVRVTIDDGTTIAPECGSNFHGFTAETNNLDLDTGCSKVGGSAPAILFSESGGGPLDLGVTVGDPHLTTVFGTHYDFMGAGEFILLEAEPGIIVQSQQKMIDSDVSVNSGLGMKIGGNIISLCADGTLSIDQVIAHLNDGVSVALANNVTLVHRANSYTISSLSGTVVRGTLTSGRIDITVSLGATDSSNVRGLLGGGGRGESRRELISRDGSVLWPPVAYRAFANYAESWRVRPGESLCGCGTVAPTMPERPKYAEDLSPQEREHAMAVCRKAGVGKDPFLSDCILDVSQMHDDNAADVFVGMAQPATVVRPHL